MNLNLLQGIRISDHPKNKLKRRIYFKKMEIDTDLKKIITTWEVRYKEIIFDQDGTTILTENDLTGIDLPSYRVSLTASNEYFVDKNTGVLVVVDSNTDMNTVEGEYDFFVKYHDMLSSLNATSGLKLAKLFHDKALEADVVRKRFDLSTIAE